MVVCSSSASVFQPGIAEQEAFAKRPFDTATSSSSSMNDEEIGEKDSKDLLTNLFHSLPNNGGEESSYNHVWPLCDLSQHSSHLTILLLKLKWFVDGVRSWNSAGGWCWDPSLGLLVQLLAALVALEGSLCPCSP